MAKVAQQHRGGEHAYLKGADSEARQIDRYQNANESVAKRPNSTGSEHEADIAPLTAGVTHRRREAMDVSQKTSRHTQSAQTGFSRDRFSERLVLDGAAI